MNMDKLRKVFVAGHRGMVGSAIVRQLNGCEDVELFVRSRAELDLGRTAQVEDFLGDHGIDQLYLAAAKVGGIQANNEYPADFIYENLRIQNSVMHAARTAGTVRKASPPRALPASLAHPRAGGCDRPPMGELHFVC